MVSLSLPHPLPLTPSSTPSPHHTHFTPPELKNLHSLVHTFSCLKPLCFAGALASS